VATVIDAGETWNTTAGDKTVTVAGMTAGDYVFVFAGTTGLAGGTTAVTDDNSSGTYTQVDIDRTTGLNTGTLTAWVRNSFVPSTASTVVTAAQTGSTGGGLHVMRVTGLTRTGTSSALQTAGQSTGTAATTPAPVFGATPQSGNPVVGAVMNGSNPAALTPRSSPAYTESADAGYNTPSAGLECMFINSGETSATITWGSTSATAFADIVVELDTTATGIPWYARINQIRQSDHW